MPLNQFMNRPSGFSGIGRPDATFNWPSGITTPPGQWRGGLGPTNYSGPSIPPPGSTPATQEYYGFPNVALDSSSNVDASGQWRGGLPVYGVQGSGAGGGGGDGTGAGGGGGDGAGGGDPSQINTSITPGSLYTPDQTQHLVNQQFADSYVPMDYAMKPFTQPGSSRGGGTAAAAMPTYAEGLLSGANARAMIPLQDRLANDAFRRQGEIARENEFLGLGGLGTTFMEQDQYERLSGLPPVLSLYDRLVGSALGGM